MTNTNIILAIGSISCETVEEALQQLREFAAKGAPGIKGKAMELYDKFPDTGDDISAILDILSDKGINCTEEYLIVAGERNIADSEFFDVDYHDYCDDDETDQDPFEAGIGSIW